MPGGTFLAMVLTAALVALLMALIVVRSVEVTASIDGPVELDVVGFPTPYPTHTPAPTVLPGQDWRGMGTILASRDTVTGAEGAAANASPLDGNEDYRWVTHRDFHPSDRVPETHSTLAVPGCITGDGNHAQRYLYSQSLRHDAPQGFMLDGFPAEMEDMGRGGPGNARAGSIYGQGVPTPIPTATPPVPLPDSYTPPTPIPTPTPDHGLWVMSYRQDCTEIGGAELQVND